MTIAITIVFIAVCVFFVAWAIAITHSNYQRSQRLKKLIKKTQAQYRETQDLLAQGYVPEFAIEGDLYDLMRRYLAGEDIPIRWRKGGK